MNKYLNYKNDKEDSENSTYKQVVYLSERNYFPGFSKRINHDEAPNKSKLINDWFCRMDDIGYLDDSNSERSSAQRIEYFWKHKSGEWVHFVTLYQNKYEWHDLKNRKPYMELFLKTFYDLKAKRIRPKDKLYVGHLPAKYDPFPNNKKLFAHKFFLKVYSIKLIASKVRPIGEVETFYRNYVNQYFDGYTENDLQLFKNLIL